jgi:uncharacterized secreted protein with C-terminal beta-propeller domain
MNENIQNNNTPSVSNRRFKFSDTKMVKLSVLLAFVLSLLLLMSKFTKNPYKESDDPTPTENNPFNSFLSQSSFKIEKFKDVEDFKNYLAKIPEDEYSSMLYVSDPIVDTFETDDSIQSNKEFGSNTTLDSIEYSAPSRISETNVQVQGIDEPDVVKIDEKSIFLSFRTNNIYDDMPAPTMIEPIIGEKKVIENRDSELTKIIKAFPPSEMESIGGIDKIGNLLLFDNTLVIFTSDTIYGYDISDRSNPSESWKIPYGDKTGYLSARLYGGEIFLVTNTTINRYNPCPYVPLEIGEDSFRVGCADIYYPVTPTPSEKTYTIIKIDAKTGKVNDSLSFLGSSLGSVMYMSPENLYITYSYSEDIVSILSKFIQEDASDLFPYEIRAELLKLSSYNIGYTAKMVEFTEIMDSYFSGLSGDEEMRVENEFENRMPDFVEKYARDFQTTGIVKVRVGNLDIKATGKIPGHPLNQFSLDEYRGDLRIATNCGLADFDSEGNVNDVYILGPDLKITGNVLDLGKDERIYSARFIGDRGYVVTFKDIDPFYVLDLSQPSKPEMKGELKISGYSSYLHPISENIILGIGKDNSKVKISLFDVSNASEPREIDNYQLDDYWSEAVNNHHAFLMDSEHNVFFMPGGKGGYIFSYKGDKLQLVRTISNSGVKRAVYLDDYMYIISSEGIVVLDENSWEEVKDYRF